MPFRDDFWNCSRVLEGKSIFLLDLLKVVLWFFLLLLTSRLMFFHVFSFGPIFVERKESCGLCSNFSLSHCSNQRTWHFQGFNACFMS